MRDQTTDILAVMTVAYRLAQATDDRDAKAYAGCLAPIVFDGAKEVAAKAYAGASIERVNAMDWTHHKLMNPLVMIDGDRASAQIDVVIDMARGGGDGACGYATIGGRYDLGFERIAGDWRIGRRTLHRRYAMGDLDRPVP